MLNVVLAEHECRRWDLAFKVNQRGPIACIADQDHLDVRVIEKCVANNDRAKLFLDGVEFIA